MTPKELYEWAVKNHAENAECVAEHDDFEKEINDRALQADINIAKSNLALIKRNLELKDALEFEGRVVEKIASTHGGFSFCDEGCLVHGHDCRWCRVKWARLAVEAEMGK